MLVLLPLLVPCVAWAQSEPVKPPAPPVFPLHRRGIYRNNQNIEVVDATPQSPPLDVDDPSVPDKGEFEVNLTTLADFSHEVRSVDVLGVDTNYGLVLKGRGHELPTQVKFEFPVVARAEADSPYAVGIGQAVFGLKFNFYKDEVRGMRVAVYPQIAFAVPGSVEHGHTLVLPFLIAKEFHLLSLVANATLDKPIHDAERQAVAEFSLGAGRAMTRKLALMASVHTESRFDFKSDRVVAVNAGVIYGVRNAVTYARVGRSLFADQDGHAVFALGIKLLFDPRH